MTRHDHLLEPYRPHDTLLQTVRISIAVIVVLSALLIAFYPTLLFQALGFMVVALILFAGVAITRWRRKRGD